MIDATVSLGRGAREVPPPVLEGVLRAEAHLLVDRDHVAVLVRVEGVDDRHFRTVLREEAVVLDLHVRTQAVTAVLRVDDGDLLPAVAGLDVLRADRRPGDELAGLLVNHAGVEVRPAPILRALLVPAYAG